MSSHFPSLIVAVVGQDRKPNGLLSHVGEKLRRRGLQAHRMRTWRDTAISNCDILLIDCGIGDADPLTKQIEHLWTQKWNDWYAAQRRRYADET